MKILMLSTDMRIFETGSAVSKRLSAYGALGDVTFLVFGAGVRREITLGENVRAVSAGGAGKASAFFAGALKLLYLTKNKGVDIISSQNPFFVGAVALMVARIRHVPFQVQLHTDCFSNAYAKESTRRLAEAIIASFVVQGASCVRVVSERVAKTARRITPKPVSVLPIFVPKPESVPVHMSQGVFTLLTVSRLTPEKRVDMLIRAIAQVAGVRLIVVGDGPLKSELQKLAENLGISDRVEFAGWQNPAAYYARANLYVQASRYEGYGMALMEAALYEVPIVATDAGIVGEVFRSGEDLLVARETPAGFAEEISRIKADSGLAARLAASARKKAESQSVTEHEYLSRYADALRTCF